MKKPYQIEAQRALKQFEAMATEGNPAVQMVLPMAEMVAIAHNYLIPMAHHLNAEKMRA